MKKWNQWIAFLGICVVVIGILAGCGTKNTPTGTQKADSTGAGKGRFVETEQNIPEHINTINSVGRSKSGELTMLGYGENENALYFAHSTDNGKEWEETKLKPIDCYVSAIDGEKGTAAVFGYEDAANMALVARDGSIQKVKLELPEYKKESDGTGDPGNFITSAVYAGEKLLVTDLNWDVYEVNQETGKMTLFSKSLTENVNRLLPIGTHFAMITDSGMQFADADSGEIIKTDAVLQKAMEKENEDSGDYATGIVMTAGASDEELYYMNHEGLFYHKSGGSTIERLIDGSLASVSDQNMAFHALFKIDDKNFLLFAVNAGKERFFSYSYDETVLAVPEKQLTVYALEDSNVLQQIITAYQAKYPDVMVKKTIGMSGEDGVTAEDAIKTLNTQVLAGNGPDVLVLDGLPVDSYIEKGALEDISSYVNNADEKEGLFINITKTYASGDALYQVPIRFYCSIVEGNSDLIANSSDLQTLETYVQKLNSGGEEKIIRAWGPETLLYSFYCVDSASWKTAEGIDMDRLKQYLQTVKTLYDADGYSEADRISDEASRNIMDGQLYSLGAQSAMDQLISMSQMAFGSLTDVTSVQQLYAAKKTQKGTFALLDQNAGKSFVPYVSLGLAKSAAENKNAQAFITLALSEEGQKQMNEGFSINRVALTQECENSSDYYIGSSYGDKSVTLDIKKISKKQKEELIALLESLDTPAWTDRVVEDLVLSEGKKYLQGKQSLEDTVSAIAGKVQLYDAE